MRTSLVIAAVIGHLAVVALCGGCTRDNNPTAIEHFLPAQSSWDAGARASIKKMSEELHRHPNAEIFRIYWHVPSSAAAPGRHYATLCLRRWRSIGYEDDPDSGFVAVWHDVSDEPIHRIACRHGTFEEFGRPSWTVESAKEAIKGTNQEKGEGGKRGHCDL